MSRRILFALILAAIGFVVFRLVAASDPNPGAVQPSVGASGSTPDSQSIPVESPAEVPRDARGPARPGAPGEQPQGELLVGRVVDAETAAPVVARLTIGSRVSSTTAAGRFSLATSDRGSPIVVEADGYGARSVDASELKSPLVVELHPEGHLRVRVVDPSGAPVPKAAVEFVEAVMAKGDPRQPIREGLSDEHGLVEFASAVPRVARLKPPALGDGILVRPGETGVLVSGAPCVAVELVDEHSAAPVSGVRARVRPTEGEALAAEVLVSGEDGRLAFPDRPGGSELELLEGFVEPSDELPAPWVRRPRTGLHLPPQGGGGALVRLPLRVGEARLLLSDAITHVPLEGKVELALSRYARTNEIPPGFFSSFPVRRGILRLPHVIAAFSEDPNCWCLIRTSGYVLTEVAGISRAYSQAPEPLPVEVQPAKKRVLRFVNSSGVPYTAYLRVGTVDVPRVLFWGQPNDLDGVVEVEWGGGDLVAWRIACPGERSDGNSRFELARVPAARLASDQEIVVVVKDEGQVQMLVVHAPVGSVLHAIDEGGGRTVALAGPDGVARFGGLLPGQILVGEAGWVDRNEYAEQLGTFPDAPTAKPGETLRVEYDPRWRLRQPIAGRVVLDEATAASAQLLPEYTTKPGAAVPIDHTYAIRVDTQGRYIVPAGDPRPERIGVWVREGVDPSSGIPGQRFLAAWVEPGSNVVPGIGGAQVTLSDASSTERVELSWNVRELDSNQMLGHSHSASIGVTVSPGGGQVLQHTHSLARGASVLLPGLPVGPLEIQCSAGEHTWKVTGTVVAGALVDFLIE
jgi:hypothetical protein